MFNELPNTPTAGVNVTLEELLALNNKAVMAIKPSKVQADGAGQHISKIRGRGMDFSEIRGYQAGDDIRHMEWRVTARTGKPHIKLYQEERERPIFLICDFNPSMYFGTKQRFKSALLAELAAILAFSASQHGDRVGGILFSGDDVKELRPRARKEGLLPLLKGLSDFTFKKQQKNLGLSEVLKILRRVAKPGSLIFILSDFNTSGDDLPNIITRLQQHSDVVAYHIVDTLEKNAPIPGNYAMTDGTNELLLNTFDGIIRKNYHALYEKKIATLEPLFKPHHFIEIPTDINLSKLSLSAVNAFAFGSRQ